MNAKTTRPRAARPATATPAAAPAWMPAAQTAPSETELVCRWELTGKRFPKVEARWVLLHKS